MLKAAKKSRLRDKGVKAKQRVHASKDRKLSCERMVDLRHEQDFLAN